MVELTVTTAAVIEPEFTYSDLTGSKPPRVSGEQSKSVATPDLLNKFLVFALPRIGAPDESDPRRALQDSQTPI
jgi:hypothetical protein